MKNNLDEDNIYKIYKSLNYTHPELIQKFPFSEICNKQILITGKNQKIKIKTNKKYIKNFDSKNNKIYVF